MMQPLRKFGAFALLGACAVVGQVWCLPALKSLSAHTAVTADAGSWRWQLPRGFPEPLVPSDNPMSEAKFQLGRYLFNDVRLSGNGTQSCGSCHQQALAFTDGRALPVGSTGDTGSRSAMSIANVAYYPTLTWANPSQGTLEIQAVVPMFVDNLAIELGINDQNKDAVLERFRQDAQYRQMFAAAFPGQDQPIHFENIVRAIASFERGVVSGNARYDQWQAGQASLSAQEERGRQLFFGDKGQCSQCHSGFNFSDQTQHVGSTVRKTPFHNTGLYNVDGKGAYPDDNPGLIGVMPQDPRNMGRFRVPSLRNIAVTAPYMHDGSIATLEQVLDFYAGHGRVIASGPRQGDGRKNPFKDPLVDKIALDAQDKQDVIAFLQTLTDHEFLANPRFANPFAVKK